MSAEERAATPHTTSPPPFHIESLLRRDDSSRSSSRKTCDAAAEEATTTAGQCAVCSSSSAIPPSNALLYVPLWAYATAPPISTTLLLTSTSILPYTVLSFHSLSPLPAQAHVPVLLSLHFHTTSHSRSTPCHPLHTLTPSPAPPPQLEEGERSERCSLQARCARLSGTSMQRGTSDSLSEPSWPFPWASRTSRSRRGSRTAGPSGRRRWRSRTDWSRRRRLSTERNRRDHYDHMLPNIFVVLLFCCFVVLLFPSRCV